MARKRSVTFAELAEALRQLGYAVDPQLSADDHTTFRHPRRRLPIYLPALKGRAVVRPIHLVAVRLMLEENKAADGREFEAWVASRGTRGVLRDLVR